jgi:NADPH:quinone reductase-like Zn-dependent oxidoreductase
MGNDREFDEVVNALREGTLAPPIDAVYPLEDACAAYERLAQAEQFGKIVLRVRDD